MESLDDTEQEQDYTPFLVADWREIPSETLEREELAQHIQSAIEDCPRVTARSFCCGTKKRCQLRRSRRHSE